MQFGPGCRGELVKRIQKGLCDVGYDCGKVDGIFGKKTADAVRHFHANHIANRNMVFYDCVDEQTWNLLCGEQPTSFEICLQLVAAFEGASYDTIVGDFDGAGLSFGILQFNLKSGSLQPILKSLSEQVWAEVSAETNAEVVKRIRDMLSKCKKSQMRWAEKISLPPRRYKIIGEYAAAFGALGKHPECINAQFLSAHSDYWLYAVGEAEKFGITSRAGHALAFDIAVQNGGVKERIQKEVIELLREQAHEGARHQMIAVLVANSVKNAYFRKDVLSRKWVIATGRGQVHGREYDLLNWGI